MNICEGLRRLNIFWVPHLLIVAWVAAYAAMTKMVGLM